MDNADRLMYSRFTTQVISVTTVIHVSGVCWYTKVRDKLNFDPMMAFEVAPREVRKK